jgi:hypothetical protein
MGGCSNLGSAPSEIRLCQRNFVIVVILVHQIGLTITQ